MRARAFLACCILAVCASPAGAQDVKCDNPDSVAALMARLKACETSGPCKVWANTAGTAVENFKAGKIDAGLCTTTLGGISRMQERLQRDLKAPFKPGGGGGGGGGGGLPIL